MNRKLLSLVLCLAMMFSLTVNVSAASVSDFKDVPSNSWYYNSVKFVAEKDYMNGTSATTFSPSDDMTRAMFVTVLSRMAKVTVDNNAETSFADVKTGQWYTGAVAWANKNGLVTGYSSTKFGTDDPITREDIAVLVDRYVKFMKYNLKTKPQVDSFKDAADISDYAKDSVEACRLAGLYYGYTDGTLKPKENVTRAEVAAIIERMELLIDEATQLTISPNGGTFTGTQKVTLSTNIEGAVIYYTTDGSEPTTSSTLYKGPFTIDKTTTVKAIAVVDGKIVATASAVFTKNSSGSGSGGGTTTPTTYTGLDYTVHVFAGKNNKEADFPAYNAGQIGVKNKNDSTYHVTLKDGKLDASKSDYITLVEVAKDLASEANIKDALDKISERTVTINGKSQALISKIDESYFVNNIVVKKVEVVEALKLTEDSDIVQEVAQELSTQPDLVMTVINKLDSGTELTGDESDIAGKFSEILKSKIGDTTYDFVGKVKENVDSALLDKLGVTDDQIKKMAIEYCNKIDALVGSKGRSNETSDNSPAGGMEVIINPVTVLYAQYPDDFDAAWNKVVNEMNNEFGVDVSDQAYKDKAKAIYDACDPKNFVNETTNGTTNEKIFKISSPGQCEAKAADVIDALEALRYYYVDQNKNTAKEDALKFLDKVVEKIMGLESALDSETRGKIAELAAINQDFNGNKAGATLYDVISQTGTAKFEVEGSAFSDYVGKVLDKLGISGDDKKDLEAEIKDILNGSFVSLEITVAECDQSNQSQVH